MVFIIQNTQNRDGEAIQLKLDEIIRSISEADNSILNTENLTEQDLQHLRERYLKLAETAEKRLQKEKKGK